jgi:hypothetical protein
VRSGRVWSGDDWFISDRDTCGIRGSRAEARRIGSRKGDGRRPLETEEELTK